MTIEEKEIEMTKRVKAKLDQINYKITNITTFFKKNSLMRDGKTYKDVLVTSFTKPLLDSDASVYTDVDTLEMLYVRTGPMNFVDIEEYFQPM